MTERKKSPLDIANDLLARHVPALLTAFAKVRGAKKAPQAMRSLQPLAFVFFLEAFGLAHLLTEEDRAAAWGAARGPGRNGDDYDPTDDTDDARMLRWVAARHAALDEAYRKVARGIWWDGSRRMKFEDWLSAGYGPNRAEFERQWGERNPIDPATAPACFDSRSQLSILDAVSPERDGILGVFVAETRLRAEQPPIVEHAGHKLDLTGCSTLSEAAWRAVCERWIVYLDHRGATVGLRLLPPLDGVRTRLRAPLVNIIASDVEPVGYEPPKPVCPRCRDIDLGTPGGTPEAPYAGPCSSDLCAPCDTAAPEPVASPMPPASTGVSAEDAARSFQSASHATLDHLTTDDDEPAAKPKPAKSKRQKASGAESAIGRKGGKRAVS